MTFQKAPNKMGATTREQQMRSADSDRLSEAFQFTGAGPILTTEGS